VTDPTSTVLFSILIALREPAKNSAPVEDRPVRRPYSALKKAKERCFMDGHIWEVAEPSEELIQHLMEAANVTRAIAVILAHRGISPERVNDFLNPALKDLSDPYLLPGTAAAAGRLWEAIHRGERICIHGDYDTDGITACVLLAWVLRGNGAEVETHLPHRIEDGYGLTTEALAKVFQQDFGLLVTVDCGITSYEAVSLARDRSLDVIVTDHHEPGGRELAAVAVVDPKLPGGDPTSADLAGVGVAFKVCHAFLKYGREKGFGGHETDLRQGLDLVALGTVADIVPLLNENRPLVRYGLSVLAKQQRPGIHALCEIAGVGETVRAADITYRLAPRLNAAGRMGDPNESLQLLEATSMLQASALARSLDSQNQKRQRIEEEAVASAEAQIAERYDLQADRAIVVWDESWHQGVVGIVASRLARRYHRPSVVLTREPSGQLTGSARSVRRLNLVSLLEKCRSVLTRFGGHAMAAGLSLQRENLSEFCGAFESAVRQLLGPDAMRPQLDICGRVSFAELTDGFFEELGCLEPFGHSNPEPLFISREVRPDWTDRAGASHTRGVLRDESGHGMNFIAFGRKPEAFPPAPWSLVYTPQLNTFGGRCTPQVRVLDVRPPVA